jgi:hypothetical protein
MYDPCIQPVKKGQQKRAHLRYRLILATLPGKNPDKFTT